MNMSTKTSNSIYMYVILTFLKKSINPIIVFLKFCCHRFAVLTAIKAYLTTSLTLNNKEC